MVRILKQIGASILIGILLFINVPMDLSAATLGNQTANVQDGLTLHCWNWSYKNIESNMEKIASQGYTAIQTSPIQQSKEGTKGYSVDGWWVYYQPMGFHIDNTGKSALGTKAEFESMCKTAHKYGIKVIVDVVANHLGNRTGNDLSDAIVADIKNDSSCWHDITKNTYDYSKRYDITQWCMNGLPDLNTGNKKVQNYVLDFLKECIDAGADGFRFDAAKHIETPDDGKDNCASDFWPTVINGAKAYARNSRGLDLYCYGELLDNPGGPLHISSYTKYIKVTDNSYSNTLREYVNKGWANEAGSPFYAKDCVANQLVLWAESHDTWADGSSSGVSVSNINKTWAIIAARADAMSLYFARPNSKSDKLGAAAVTGWAKNEVKQVNLFHNFFVGQSEYMATENGVVYCERGNSGVVLVNCVGNGAGIDVTAHNIKDGKYKDQISGNTFTVSNGRIKGSIGNTGIAVVYNIVSNEVVPSQNNVAYIDLPSGWSGNVYCYAYDSATEQVNNGEWPGAKMEHVSGNVYKYKVPSNIVAPRVIFYCNDNCRYPGDMEEGLLLSGSMIYVNGTWKKYEVNSIGKIIVNYHDEAGNILQASSTMEGKIGSAYQIIPKDISGYEYVRSDGNVTGAYKDGIITVSLIYKKNETPTVTNPSEEETTTIIEETPNNETKTPENNTTTYQEETKQPTDNNEDKNKEPKFNWIVVVIPVGVIVIGGIVFVIVKNKSNNN